MTKAGIKTMLASLKIPFEYYQFPDGTAQKTPFICFYYPSSDDFIADDKNYATIRRLIIELYTDTKDFTTEAQIETLLKNNNLVYVYESTYLDDERMYMTIYTTEVLLDG